MDRIEQAPRAVLLQKADSRFVKSLQYLFGSAFGRFEKQWRDLDRC
jgi:hypothetical protein